MNRFIFMLYAEVVRPSSTCSRWMVYNHGFKQHEITLIRSLVEENADVIAERWQEFFGNKNNG